MRHFVTYPLIAHPYSPELVGKQAIVRFATRAEELGFDGLGFTDHPAPSHRWLLAGGHDALDPFVALGLVAAVTERLRLVPHILVLPYRNPFLVAKAAATLDAVSGGRFVLAVATGYQRGEYRALGVDFEERNQLFDEALAVIRGVWSEDDFAYDGLHFTARARPPTPSRRTSRSGSGATAPCPAGGWRRRATAGPVRGPGHAGPDGEDPGARIGRRPGAHARPPLAVRRRGGPRPRRHRRLAAGARLRAPRETRGSTPSTTWTRWARWPASA